VIQEQPFTPTIIQIMPGEPAAEVTMIDVALAAFGVTGVIMVAAVIAGLSAGALTIIEERGHQHNLFRV
jgi:hypothetical protein